MTAHLWGLVLVMMTASCTRDVPVEHVKHNPDSDAFELGVTKVSTFKNKNAVLGDDAYRPAVDELDGEFVTIKGGGRLLLNFCRLGGNPDTISRSEFYQLGIVSAPRTVNLQYNTRWDGTVYAVEHDSLAMLTAYVNFDGVRTYFRDVIRDDSDATGTPAVLAYYGELGLGCGSGRYGLSLPVGATDNAAFVGTADLFIILRDAVLAGGIELGSNPGVAAHEFSHRIFQHNVYAGERGFRLLATTILGDDTQQNRLCVDETDPSGVNCEATVSLLKGMDEGTADIFAYIYTGQAGFFLEHTVGITGLGAVVNEDKMRNLAREPELDGELPIYSLLARDFAAQGQLQFYRLGTLWSRAFYRSVVDPQTGAEPVNEEARVAFARAHYGRAVLRALRRLGEDFTAPVGGRDFTYRFDPRQLIRRYIEEVSRDEDTGVALPAVRAAACRELCNRFGEPDFVDPLNGASPQCGGVIGQNAFSTSPIGIFPCTL